MPTGVDRILNRRLAVHLIGEEHLLGQLRQLIPGSPQLHHCTDRRTPHTGNLNRLKSLNRWQGLHHTETGQTLDQHATVLGRVEQELAELLMHHWIGAVELLQSNSGIFHKVGIITAEAGCNRIHRPLTTEPS